MTAEEVHSEMYRRFIASVEPKADLWIDGFDEEALLSLSGKELERAQMVLLDLLGKGDERAATALALIGSHAGVEAMRFMLPRARDEQRVILASAIWKATKARIAVGYLIDEARTGSARSKLKAADALTFIDGNVNGVDECLLELVENSDDTDIIWSASSGLLFRRGLMVHPLSFDYRDLRFGLISPADFVRRSAQKNLRSLIGLEIRPK